MRLLVYALIFGIVIYTATTAMLGNEINFEPQKMGFTQANTNCVPSTSECQPVAVTFEHNPYIINYYPIANAGPDQNKVPEGTLVTLTGSAIDQDGDALTYSWTQIAGPLVTLSNANTANPTFTPWIGGERCDPELRGTGNCKVFTFQLEVSDGKSSDWDTVSVLVQAK